MARFLIAGGLVAAAAADALSGLVLVQLKADVGARLENGRDRAADSTGDLPDVALLFPKKTFSDVTSKLVAFERRVGDALRRDEAKIVHQRAELEERLTRQRQNTATLERANAAMALRAKRVKDSNAGLRRRARDLAKANDDLRSELKELQANLTLAQEFLTQGLIFAENDEPEVRVLAELAELDANANKIMEKQARLNEIAGVSMSLLDFSGQEHGRAHSHREAEESPEVLMQHVAAHLEELSEERNASEASLRKAFNEKFQIETRKQAELLEEQTRLNSSAAEALVLHEKLSAALKHLSKAHEQLVQRIKAIKRFAQRLGTSNLGERTHPATATSVRVPRHHEGRQGNAETNASAAVARVHSGGAAVGATKNMSEAREASVASRQYHHVHMNLSTRESKTPVATEVPVVVTAAADKPSKDNATKLSGVAAAAAYKHSKDNATKMPVVVGEGVDKLSKDSAKAIKASEK